MPLVSVVMPVYNNEKYVGKAVDSILNQTFKDFEFIIVNDGSADNTLKAIEDFNDKRIRIISFPTNRGIVDALNEGIKASAGTYIARQDSDDISLPERLEKQIRVFEAAQGLVLVATQIRVVSDIPAFDTQSLEDYFSRVTTREGIRNEFANCSNPICHPTVMFRKDIFDELGGYRKEYEFAEDMDLWFRMIKVGDMAKVPEKLVVYRRHPGAVCIARPEKTSRSYDNVQSWIKGQ